MKKQLGEYEKVKQKDQILVQNEIAIVIADIDWSSLKTAFSLTQKE